MAILLKASGEILPGVRPAQDRASFTLAELQGFVGGYIEVVRVLRGQWLVLNEHGKLEGLPPNMGASLIFWDAGGLRDDTIVGDVLLASTAEIEGEEAET